MALLILDIIFLLIPVLLAQGFEKINFIKGLYSGLVPGDLLQYEGAILGAGITIIGIVLTIGYSQQNYNQETLNRVLPFFSINEVSLASGEPLDTYSCFVLQRDSIKMLVDEGTDLKSAVNQDYDVLKCYEIENVGNGAAVGCTVHLLDDDENDASTESPMTIKTGNGVKVFILLKDAEALCNKMFSVAFIYCNIFGNEYVQRQEFLIGSNGQIIQEVLLMPQLLVR